MGVRRRAVQQAVLRIDQGDLRAEIDEVTLSRLLVDGKVALLLNGWNEIPADDKGRATAGADDFLGGHPGALVVCTSRRAEGPALSAVVPNRRNELSAPEDRFAFFHERGLPLLVVFAGIARIDHLLAKLEVALGRIFAIFQNRSLY